MSQVASAISQKETYKSMAWRYSLAGERDLRIDFMRGIALVMMVVAHTEVMSIFNIFSWERIGLKGSPTKIAKASDKVAKGAGEKVNLDPAESVAYLIGKFKEKHII